MLEIRAKDGTIFDPFDAEVSIQPKGSPKVYRFEDLLVLGILDPHYDVVHGTFGESGRGMPIRGLRFTDLSDFAVEIPMPVPDAQALGRELAASKIETVRSMPTQLLIQKRHQGS